MRNNVDQLEMMSADFETKSVQRSRIALIGLCAAMLTGCGESHPNTPPPQPPAELLAASQALSNHQPPEAIADARAFLMNHPTGPLAAQALYFEGRGEEERVPMSADDRARNLSEAHSSYLLALQQAPGKALETDIHISLSNVAFYQDEYAESIQEASVALSMVPANSPTKAYLQYRTGVAQQRLGRFTDADQTFRQVQQHYPNSNIAAAAKGNEGQRKFYVQLATFSTQEAANQATASLETRGMVVSQRSDSKGHSVIDVGSFDTFPQAKKVRDQLLNEFPDAIIVP